MGVQIGGMRALDPWRAADWTTLRDDVAVSGQTPMAHSNLIALATVIWSKDDVATAA